jgi:coenzyme F420 hydrogenase subunit beta
MACPDFANEFADISAGGLGSPDGYTTVVVRTSLGQELYNGALQDGAIEEFQFASDEEASLHRTQIIAKASAFTRRKRERARAKLAALPSTGRS